MHAPQPKIACRAHPELLMAEDAKRAVRGRGCCAEVRQMQSTVGALSQESRSKGNGQVNMSHGSAFVSPTSLSGRDHSARDLALSPLHPELPRRGGTARRAWARRLI